MEDIIWCVKQHPHLYDQVHVNSTVAKQREDSWSEIALDLGLSAEFIKKKWKSLRGSYVKYLKRDPKYFTYKWSDHMDFVRPYIDLNTEDQVDDSFAEGEHDIKYNDKQMGSETSFGVGEALTPTSPKKKKKVKKHMDGDVAVHKQFDENLVSSKKSHLEENHIPVKEPQLDVPGSFYIHEVIPEINTENARATLSSPAKIHKSSPRKKMSSFIPMQPEKVSVSSVTKEAVEIKIQHLENDVNQTTGAASGHQSSSEVQLPPEKKAEVKKAAPRKRRQTIKQSEIESLKSAAVLHEDNDMDISQNSKTTIAVSTPIADKKPASFQIKLLPKKAAPRKRKPTEKKAVVELSEKSAADADKPLQLNGYAATASVKKVTRRKSLPTVKETDARGMANVTEAQKSIQPNGDETPVAAQKKAPPKRRPTMKDTSLLLTNFEDPEEGKQHVPIAKIGPPPKKRPTKAEVEQSKNAQPGTLGASFLSLENVESTSNVSKIFKPQLNHSMESSSASQFDLNTTVNSSQFNQSLDGTELLFLGFAKTLKNFAPKRQSLTKLEIAKIIMEQEMYQFDDEDRETSASKH